MTLSQTPAFPDEMIKHLASPPSVLEQEGKDDMKQTFLGLMGQAKNHVTACTPIKFLSPKKNTADDDEDDAPVRQNIDQPTALNPAGGQNATQNTGAEPLVINFESQENIRGPDSATKEAFAEPSIVFREGQQVIRGPDWSWEAQV